MARLVQIFDQNSGDLLLEVESAVSYTLDGEVEATDHPVEQGANITDHLRPKPRTLAIEGWISNTPLKTQQESPNEYPTDEPGPAEATYMLLENRRLGGFLHTVITRLDTFQNMALVHVSEPRSSAVGDALQFSLTFKEIRIVQNQTITVQTATPQGQPKKAIGKKVTAPITPSTSDKTVLKSITDGLGVTTAGSGL
jgi:hypothetical protein